MCKTGNFFLPNSIIAVLLNLAGLAASPNITNSTQQCVTVNTDRECQYIPDTDCGSTS